MNRHATTHLGAIALIAALGAGLGVPPAQYYRSVGKGGMRRFGEGTAQEAETEPSAYAESAKRRAQEKRDRKAALRSSWGAERR